MNFFQKIFGRKPKEAPVINPTLPSSSPLDPAKDPNMIRVFDGYGREMFITKQAWRDGVLLGNLKKVWNRPDELYNMIISALNDGFRSDVVDATRHLYKIDSNRVRATCVWGIILMEENRLDEAEKVLRHHLEKYGEQGVVLTNLAKVYSKRKKEAKSLEILWRGLQVDPNQDNGVAWYEVIHREHDGEEAGLEALRRIAALPGSWRAQLWLARAALKARQLDSALNFYHESLARCGNPVPHDLLMQMSGDLGQYGYLPELLKLTEPHFEILIHGIQVGNNLIKAHLDLGQIDPARKILDQLYALKRPDWKQSLSFWDTEIAKTHVESSQASPNEPLNMTMLTIEGPIWLKPSSPAVELFPAKSKESLVICFLGSSSKTANHPQGTQLQMSDGPGRLSRALPLFLAEQVEFRSLARTQTLIPWITNGNGAFVLSGVPWNDEEAANYARLGEIKADYVVTLHLNAIAEPWQVQLALVRTIDGKQLGRLEASFAPLNPDETICTLAGKLLSLLADQAEVEPLSPSPLYQLPDVASFPNYLLRLEQLLSVRCGAMDKAKPGFLSGEREIIDGNLQLCLAFPENIPVRLLFIQTLLLMEKIRPEVVTEFRDKIALLQKEKPLEEPVNRVVQRILNVIPKFNFQED